MFRLIPILILLCFVFPAAGLAKVVDETQVDQKVREIAKTLRCTVCQTENIWESGAPLAHQMREAVRERVMQGQSAEEIRAYFHSRYGDYIMMEPPKQGFNWLIWLAPFLLLFGGGVLLWREVKGWVTRTPAPPPPPALAETARRRIGREVGENQ
ncbi:MAG: cytochrome c-type biogenesis protein CcmH [Nitrospira sp. SB0677_bin_15]|nr:cytochrome c-type biogenesis protein CcmH [Nitrospira sp. SB0677_bin_15]